MKFRTLFSFQETVIDAGARHLTLAMVRYGISLFDVLDHFSSMVSNSCKKLMTYSGLKAGVYERQRERGLQPQIMQVILKIFLQKLDFRKKM